MQCGKRREGIFTILNVTFVTLIDNLLKRRYFCRIVGEILILDPPEKSYDFIRSYGYGQIKTSI